MHQNLKILGILVICCFSFLIIPACDSDSDDNGYFPFFCEGEWIGRTEDDLYVYFRVEELEDATAITEAVFKVEPNQRLYKESYAALAIISNRSFSLDISEDYLISGTFHSDSTMSGTCTGNGRTITFVGKMSNGNDAPYPPNLVAPESGSSVSTDNLELVWNDSYDMEGDDIVYDLFFGTSSNPPLLVNGYSDDINSTTSFTYEGQLETGATYYWNLVARDSYGNEVDGPVWSFHCESL